MVSKAVFLHDCKNSKFKYFELLQAGNAYSPLKLWGFKEEFHFLEHCIGFKVKDVVWAF